MHELITRSLECFLRDTYGEKFWANALRSVGLSPSHVDFLFNGTDQQIRDTVTSAARMLDKPQDVLLEDMGTYMVSHANSTRIRRLLRFSGETFEDFLHSLDDLPDRARLAVGDLLLPAMELLELSPGHYRLDIAPTLEGFPSVLRGALQALADDYGALVLLEVTDPDGDDPEAPHSIQIALLDEAFAEGKEFDLSSSLGAPATTAVN